MIILPFILSILLSTGSIQSWFNRQQRHFVFYALGLLSFIYLLGDLIQRTLQWQVVEAFRVFPTTPVNLAIKVVANHSDPVYTNLIFLGAAITLTSLVCGGVLVWRERKNLHKENTPIPLSQLIE
jgi:hypothetical protein